MGHCVVPFGITCFDGLSRLPPAQSVLGSIALGAFRASKLDFPHTTVVAEPAEVRMTLVATSRFISIFPDAVLKFSDKRNLLKVLAVKQRLGRLPIGIVTLKNRTIGPVAQLFSDAARKVAKTFVR